MGHGILIKEGEAASLFSLINKLVHGWNWGGVLNVVMKFIIGSEEKMKIYFHLDRANRLYKVFRSALSLTHKFQQH